MSLGHCRMKGSNEVSSVMIPSLQIRALIASPIVRSIAYPREARKGSLWAELLHVLGNPRELRSAAIVASIFFVASLAAAPVLTRDENKLAAEINGKTLKAAATIKAPSRFPLRGKN